MGASLIAQPARIKGMSAAGTASYYIFNNQGGKGFTIVAGDDRLPDVVGYADEGNLEADHLPEGLQWLLDNYSKTVEALDASPQLSTKIQQRKTRRNAVAKAVAPLLKSKWGQGEPYNNLCPQNDNGYRTMTGCVATALAQILYYYKPEGEMTRTIPGYTSDHNDYGGRITKQIESITGSRTYDWDLMLEEYNKDKSGNALYSEAAVAEVSKLIYHIGVASQMSYGIVESGCNSAYAIQQLPKYFPINADSLHYEEISGLSLAKKQALVDAELLGLNPVYMAGGGHAFVVDGKDRGELYHFNWGYNGSSDGYYDLVTCMIYASERVGIGFRQTPANGRLDAELRLQTYYEICHQYPIAAGTEPGFYAADAVANFESVSARVEEALADASQNETSLRTLRSELEQSYTLVRNSLIRFPKGYYYLVAADTALCANNGYGVFRTLQSENPAFLWQLAYDERTGFYQVQNLSSSERFNAVTVDYDLGVQRLLKTSLDPVESELDILPVAYEGNTVSVALMHRSQSIPEHWIGLGQLVAFDKEANAQYLLDLQGTNLYDKALAALTDARTPMTYGGTGMVTSGRLSSPYNSTRLSTLVDNKANTYWESGTSYVEPGTHYFQVRVYNPETYDKLMFAMTRRSNVSENQITEIGVYGTNTRNAAKGDCTKLATIQTPFTEPGESLVSEPFTIQEFSYIRFYLEATNSYNGFGHLAEFQLYPIMHQADDDTQSTRISEACQALQLVLDARPEPITEQYIKQLEKAYADFLCVYNSRGTLKDLCNEADALYQSALVGSNPGQYGSSEKNALKNALNAALIFADAPMDLCSDVTLGEQRAALKAAMQTLIASRVPFADGRYYLLNNATYSDGEIKALTIGLEGMKWCTLEEGNDAQKWMLKGDANTGLYALTNVADPTQAIADAHLQNVKYNTEKGMTFSICSAAELADYNWLCAYPTEGSTEGEISRWSASDSYSVWYLKTDDTYNAIASVISESPSHNGEFYSLTGQRLSAPRKGVNIIRGRKILVK